MAAEITPVRPLRTAPTNAGTSLPVGGNAPPLDAPGGGAAAAGDGPPAAEDGAHAEHLHVAPSPVPTSDGERDPEVQLRIPASSRFLRLARLTAAGLAGDLDYGIDEIEDLRVAVDELCAAVVEGTPADATLELTYRLRRDGVATCVEVEGLCHARTASAPELSPIARELLSILADEYTLGSAGGHRTFRLLKRGGAARA
jgi:serine/threonine-protein kinase RsbW